MMSSDDERRSSLRPACASCKHQRKKCLKKCVLAPHFPPGLEKEFEQVHKLFGISNMTKMIRKTAFPLQKEMVKSFIWEASLWRQDPDHGPLGFYNRLDQRNNFLEQRNNFLERERELYLRNQMVQLPMAQLPYSSNNGFWTVPYYNGQSLFQANPATLDTHGNISSSSSSSQRGVHGLDRLIQEQARQSNGRDGNIPHFYHPNFVQEQNYQPLFQGPEIDYLIRGGFAHTSNAEFLERGERASVGGHNGQFEAPHSSPLQRQESTIPNSNINPGSLPCPIGPRGIHLGV
ncbi:LOB domain-containing protein [Actinidia chinensis var. chinensis]|uniref:LOB domain-containing protein n=1 Tax=Actinidia chinensis var. chinensis TaxID=1590841 RepID=A0A2R6QLB3_ACTCC|nr:LOB domain-containing protein [Actinidia chinensis var. chinensis]